MDENGHGTHIAGIIGALNNHYGVVGVAPKVSLYAIKVLNASGKGTISNLIRGVDRAIANRMHILNISISGGKLTTPLLDYVLQAAVKRGIWGELQPETPERRRGQATPFRFRRGWRR